MAECWHVSIFKDQDAKLSNIPLQSIIITTAEISFIYIWSFVFYTYRPVLLGPAQTDQDAKLSNILTHFHQQQKDLVLCYQLPSDDDVQKVVLV